MTYTCKFRSSHALMLLYRDTRRRADNIHRPLKYKHDIVRHDLHAACQKRSTTGSSAKKTNEIIMCTDKISMFGDGDGHKRL